MTSIRHGARLRAFLLSAAMALLAALPLRAETALSDADKRDIARVEAYLNTVASLEAKFLQRSSAGEFAEGRLYLRRPNRVRLDYRPPTFLQIYASGYWLVYVDTEMEEVTHVPLESTPAGFLVAERVSLTGDITVTKVERNTGILRLHVVQTEEPEAGKVILTLRDSPLRLSHWTVVDAQGVETLVSLLDPQFNVALDDKLFQFDPAKFGAPEPP